MSSNSSHSARHIKFCSYSPVNSRIYTGTFTRATAVVLALAALLLFPAALFAQPPAIPRIAILWPGAPGDETGTRAMLAQGLREHGYELGRNVLFDERWLGARNERASPAIGELIQGKPAVLVVAGSHSILAAKAATSSIPIVMATVGDPVSMGLVASLARPSGNITGNAMLTEVLGAKRFEILREILPNAKVIGYFSNASNAGFVSSMRPVEARAKKLGVQIVHFGGTNEAELERALGAMGSTRPDAVLFGADGLNLLFRQKINASLAANRIPAMHSFSEAVVDGGLISYAPSTGEFFRNAASFVDRILKGAKPGDLPIEQPTKFELVVNLKTAKALGITIPQSVLLRADRVIE